MNDPAPDDETVNSDVKTCSQRTIISQIAHISAKGGSDTCITNASDVHTHLPDPLVEEIRGVAAADGVYTALISAIESGFPERRYRNPASVATYWGIIHQLTVYKVIVLFSSRIVIAQAVRKNILKKLHAAHQEIVRTNRWD